MTARLRAMRLNLIGQPNDWLLPKDDPQVRDRPRSVPEYA